MSGSRKHASQQVKENDQIAVDVIDFHDHPLRVGRFKQKSEPLSSNQSNEPRRVFGMTRPAPPPEFHVGCPPEA
jgi:hypothetical protein